MFNTWDVVGLVVVYLLILFGIAYWGERRKQSNRQRPVIYSLALGVHCTSWAFFGTTIQAAQYGWAFIPTYMGIILVFVFAHPLLKRIAAICHQHNVSSLADFISLRYQKSYLVAALVTLLCFFGVIPYIALQLDALTSSINVITDDSDALSGSIGIYVAALMAFFAILFGTRTLSLTEKHPGLMLAIAFESLIKLAGLVVVGLFACYVLFDGVFDLLGQAQLSPVASQTIHAESAIQVYISHMLLGVCSMFCLPRQFHINYVENNGAEELNTARWLFPLYLTAVSLFVLPIALAGEIIFADSHVSTDTFALALPVYAGNEWVTLISFIGGLSAATSMVIVATLAMGVMISNNLITPLWVTLHFRRSDQHNLKPSAILLTRRLTVLVVLAVAYFYHLQISQTTELVKSGMIAIALLSQSMPALLFGLYWQRGSKAGALAGLGAGAICWSYFLLWPSIKASYYFEAPPDDITLSYGFVISLLVNCICFVLVSLISSRQDNQHTNGAAPSEFSGRAIQISNLLVVTERVLSSDRQALLKDSLPSN